MNIWRWNAILWHSLSIHSFNVCWCNWKCTPNNQEYSLKVKVKRRSQRKWIAKIVLGSTNRRHIQQQKLEKMCVRWWMITVNQTERLTRWIHCDVMMDWGQRHISYSFDSSERCTVYNQLQWKYEWNEASFCCCFSEDARISIAHFHNTAIFSLLCILCDYNLAQKWMDCNGLCAISWIDRLLFLA